MADHELQIETRSYRVEGRVQGVGFRAFVRREGRERGLSGWARNEPDGSVTVVARGEPSDLARFEERLHQGPPTSWVERVESRRGEGFPAVGGLEVRF